MNFMIVSGMLISSSFLICVSMFIVLKAERSSKEWMCCACDPSVHLLSNVPFIGFICAHPHLGV